MQTVCPSLFNLSPEVYYTLHCSLILSSYYSMYSFLIDPISSMTQRIKRNPIPIYGSRNRNASLMTKRKSNKNTVCNISLMLQAPHFFLKSLANAAQKCIYLSPHCENPFPVFKGQDTSLHLTLDSTCLPQIPFSDPF